MKALTLKAPLATSVLAAFGASACCVAPLALMALGLGGAGAGALAALEPYRPAFIALSAVSLGFAFRRSYSAPQACAPEASCAEPGLVRRRRVALWVVALVSLLLIAVPWVA